MSPPVSPEKFPGIGWEDRFTVSSETAIAKERSRTEANRMRIEGHHAVGKKLNAFWQSILRFRV